jgi:hypothetical protein
MDIRFDGFELKFIIAVGFLLVAGAFNFFERCARFANVCCVIGLWLLLGMVSIIFCYMFATLKIPLYDKELSMLDKALGFDWLSYYHFGTRQEIVNKVLKAAYSSLGVQTLLTVLFLAFRRKFARNLELVWITLVALLLTAAISGLIPAVGALYYYQIGLEHAVHLQDYFALRTGEPMRFALENVRGIITFPSFHTSSAILLMYAHRGERSVYLFVPANILMLLATPIFGGHYLVDLLGGLAVAVVSIFAVQYAKASKPRMQSDWQKKA